MATTLTPALTAPRRMRRDAERNRERILQAAREVFARRGLEATLHHIAEHAELGVGTIYRHFRNRDQLLDELFDESLERLERVGQDALACEDPWDGFVQFLERSVEMTTNDRGLWTLAIGGSNKTRHLAKGRTQFWRVVPQLLERAKAAGALRSDVRAEDVTVVTVMVGASAQFTGEQSPQAWRRYLALVLEGMRAERIDVPLPSDALRPSELDAALSAWYPSR